jgi:hypothetical protein
MARLGLARLAVWALMSDWTSVVRTQSTFTVDRRPPPAAGNCCWMLAREEAAVALYCAARVRSISEAWYRDGSEEEIEARRF